MPPSLPRLNFQRPLQQNPSEQNLLGSPATPATPATPLTPGTPYSHFSWASSADSGEALIDALSEIADRVASGPASVPSLAPGGATPQGAAEDDRRHSSASDATFTSSQWQSIWEQPLDRYPTVDASDYDRVPSRPGTPITPSSPYAGSAGPRAPDHSYGSPRLGSPTRERWPRAAALQHSADPFDDAYRVPYQGTAPQAQLLQVPGHPLQRPGYRREGSDNTLASVPRAYSPHLRTTASAPPLLPTVRGGSTPSTSEASSIAPSGVWPRLRGELSRQVDPRFLVSLVDPRDVLLPLTARKAMFFSVYAGIVVGLVFLDQHYALKDHFVDAMRYQNAALMGVIYGLEPALVLLIFALARYPERAPSRPRESLVARRVAGASTEDTAYVVPCYNSDPESLQRMLTAALRHFAPEQIFIVDNANASKPMTDTKAQVRAIDPAINYMWSPLGSKNFAQYVGSLAAHRYRYVMTTDDDVCLPDNFVAPHRLLHDDVKGVALPVCAVNSAGKRPNFIGWQDLEYKMAGFSKLAEQRAGSVLYPHGAGSFWDREAFLQVLRRHDLIFFAEDCKLGFAAMSLDYRLAIDSTQILTTEAPETLFGKAPNWYAQRVRSWEMGRHVITPRFVKALFSNKGCKGAGGFAMQKMLHTYAIASNAIDFLRLPLYLAVGSESSFWVRTSAFAMAPILPGLVYKYGVCRKRPDLAPSLAAVATLPAYKMLYSAASILGAARALYFYWPSFKKRLTIPQMEKVDDPRCFYLSERFAADPGYLGHAEATEEKTQIETFMAVEDLSTEMAMAPPPVQGTQFAWVTPQPYEATSRWDN